MNSKRKYERFDLVLSVHVKDKQGTHKLNTGNISKYGLFLETTEPKPLRQLIQLVIEIEGKTETIHALAQVMWADATGESERSHGIAGMGVKFFSLPDDEQQKWEHFVDLVRSGRFVPEEKIEVKKEKALDDGNVYSIGEEELVELEDLDIDEVSQELEEEIIDIEEEIEEDVRVEDVSGLEDEYDAGREKIRQAESDEESERRVFPRKPVQFLVKVEDIDSMRELYTRDISLGGMFIHTTLEKDIDATVSIVIVHPWTAEEFEIESLVKRIEKSETGKMMGLGVEFKGINDSLRDSILTYIESGYVILKSDDDTPIESEIIKRIEAVEEKIKTNPIDSKLHYKVALLYLSLSNWEQSYEHIDIALKLGYSVPKDITRRLEKKRG